ncbi:MAG: Fe-S cluster assembly protein IscX [Alphaproteobacteria bacterium]
MKWKDIEDIAEILEEKYPEENIMQLRFTRLHKLITELEDFKDDHNKSNEKILENIQATWFELRQENR